MARMTTIEDLFLEELRDLYDAEIKQLTRALPKMAEAVSSADLRNAFEEHLDQTENHVERLDRIFASLGQEAISKKCAVMAGLIKDGNEVVSGSGETAVRDAGLIAVAQKVEHYEISGYGSARMHARILGLDEAAGLLEKTLHEEIEADRRLSELAMSTIDAEVARRTAADPPAVRAAG